MDINLEKKNAIYGLNLNKIGHFLVKMAQIRSFGGQNDVIGQNLVKVVKKFYLYKFLKIISVMFMTKIW